MERATSWRLKRYLEHNDVNAAVFFLTAFQLLLSQSTGNQDIIVGLPVLHRPKKEMAESLGLFVNQLPLRNTIDTTQDFLTLANNNQTKMLALINHSGYPFSEIVKAINAPRSHTDHPIFQIGYRYQNFVQQDWLDSNQGLVESIWDEFQRGPELEFSLEVTPLPDQYRVTFNYDAGVYDKDTLEPLARSYAALLEDILFADAIPVGNYPLFSDAPSTQISSSTASLPPTKTEYPATTVVDLFEAQAAKAPHRTALTFASQTLSYGALNQQANAFAHYLLEQGVRPETRIGLCVAPSFDLVIAIVGILKAGAAYVPIDPKTPQARMHFIVEDASPEILLLTSDSVFHPKAGGSRVIYLDTWLRNGSTPSVASPNLARPKTSPISSTPLAPPESLRGYP